MERRTMRKKPGMLKRTMVSILSLVMLLSLVSPGFYAGAQESETTAPTVAETDAAVVPEANDVETLDNTSNVGEESTVVEGSEEDEAAAPAEENTSDVGEEETTSEDTVPETTETEAVEEDTTEGAAEEETTSDETVTDESADNTADVGEEGIAPEEGAASNDTMNDKMNDRPGEGSGMMGNELDVSYFRTTPSVMYDIFTAETDSSGEITGGEQASNNVQPKMTVTLNGLAVEWNYSGDSSNATTTNTLGDYFPTATTSAAGTADLEITPPDGYYVSAIVVACTSSGNSGPYDCNTWAEGNAYNGTFSYDGMGEFVLEDFSSLNFSHMSSSNNSSNHYFILIELSPIPTPLYVEYNYGLIVDHMTTAGLSSEYTDEFTKNADWTTASSSNVYGTADSVASLGGGLQTNYTQMKYVYNEETPSEAGLWTHTTNTISTDAALAAAAAGYYFVRWDVNMYESIGDVTKGGETGTANNYTYPFEEYKSSGTASANSAYTLKMHTEFIAVWAPVKLNVVKDVNGLPEGATTNHTLSVTKDDAAFKTAAMEVTADGTDSESYSPITPGTYTVSETETTSSVTVGDTIYYLISPVCSDPVEVTAANIANGTQTEVTLTVTNTYSNATPKIKLVKQWQNHDGSALTDTSLLPDSVNFNIMAGDTEVTSQDVTKANSWVATMDIPTGYNAGQLTVTEDAITGFEQVGSAVVTTENDTDNKIVYTVYTITNKLNLTSITLDKVVTGNMGDLNKVFSFNVYVNGTKFGETIEMSDGTPVVTIENIPIGSKVEIIEDENNYTTTHTIDGGDAISGTTATIESVGASGHAVVFTNKNEANIDTGITLDSMPFIFLFLTSAAAAMLMLTKRRYTGKF